MSFNIEWTNADALTPSPFTVTKDGCHYEVKVDAHYVSDEEMQTLRRYVERLQVENAKLRELVAAMPYCMEARCLECPMCSPFDTSIGGVPECRASWKLSALGVEVDDGAR